MTMRRSSLKFSTLVVLALCLVAVVLAQGPLQGLWTTMPSLPQEGGSGIARHTATLLGDGNILIVGGVTGNSAFPSASASAAMYLPNLNQWTQVPNMFLPRVGHGAALLPDGASVLVAGGETGSASINPGGGPCGLLGPATGTTEAEVFNEATFGWAHALSMNSPRADFSLVRLPNGKILAAAGSTTDQTAEVYDPSSNTWSYTGGMNAQRSQAAYTLLPDGRVFVAGGDFGFSVSGIAVDCPSDAEVYDPSANTWSNAGKMAVNRYGATATVVCVTATIPCPANSWRVLVAGGFDGNNQSSSGDCGLPINCPSAFFNAFPSLNTTELWNPSTNSFTPAASMPTARDYHTATLLPNGQVLLAGGFTNAAISDAAGDVTNFAQATSFAEIYDPTTDSWQVVRSMNSARGEHTATAELGPGPTKILFAGGAQPSPPPGQGLFILPLNPMASVEIFQPTPITTTTSLFPSQPLPGNNTVSSCTGGLESFVASSTGLGAPTGFVSFFDSAAGNFIGSPVPLSPVALSNSEAILNAPLFVGTHSIQAFYGGTDAFSSSNSSFLTVQAISPPIQVTGPGTAFFGDPVTLVASVPAGATSPFNFTWTPPNNTTAASCNIAGCFAGVPPSLGANVFTVTGTDSTGCHLGTGSFTVNVVGGGHFAVSAPPSVLGGSPFSFTVTALDGSNNILRVYNGTVHLTSSDPQATLPSDYTFTNADSGVHTFTAKLVTGGNQTITATDTASAAITGTSAPILVNVPDFTLTATSPVNGTPDSTETSTVNVGSLFGFSSPVTLSTSAPPSGVTTSFSSNPVTPPSGGSTSSTLTIHISASVTPSTFSLTVTGTSGALTHSTVVTVNVTAAPGPVAAVISDMTAAACIDNSGISGALTNKLTAAQSSISAGDAQTAINTLTALKNQIQAQAGKHITASCSMGGVVFNPPTTLLMDVQGIINNLRTSNIADPITGYVVNSANLGVPGAVVSILDSNGNTLATATTDITGFYYFPTTGVLTAGSNYAIAVSGLPSGFTTSTPASQLFAWQGTGLAFNFALN